MRFTSLILLKSQLQEFISTLLCCGGPAVVFVTVLALLIKSSSDSARKWQEWLRKKGEEYQQAREGYYNSLEELKRNPVNANLKESTLALGRKYSAISREFHQGDRTVTIVDEVVLMNDINAACAGAVRNSTGIEAAMAVEQRLAKLAHLKEKGLLTDEEYNQQRQRLLDEI